MEKYSIKIWQLRYRTLACSRIPREKKKKIGNATKIVTVIEKENIGTNEIEIEVRTKIADRNEVVAANYIGIKNKHNVRINSVTVNMMKILIRTTKQ